MSLVWAAPGKPAAFGPKRSEPDAPDARVELQEVEVALNKIATAWIKEKYLVKRGGWYELPPGAPPVNIKAFAAENEEAIASCVEDAKVWLDRIDVVPSQKQGFVARIHAVMTSSRITSSMYETNSQRTQIRTTLKVSELSGIRLTPYKVKLTKEKNEYELRAYRIMAKIRSILEIWGVQKHYLVRREITQSRNGKVDVVHTLSDTFGKNDTRVLGKQAAADNADEFSYIARPGDKVWISGVNFYVNKKASQGTAWAATKATALMDLGGHFIKCEQGGTCSEITQRERDAIIASQYVQIFPGPLTGKYPNAGHDEDEEENGGGAHDDAEEEDRGGALDTGFGAHDDEEENGGGAHDDAEEENRGGALDTGFGAPDEEEEGGGGAEDHDEEMAAAPQSDDGIGSPGQQDLDLPGQDEESLKESSNNEDDRAVAKAWYNAVDAKTLPPKKRFLK